MSSPFITQLMNEPSRKLKGKNQVAACWRHALEQKSALKFELLHTPAGTSSVVAFYRTYSSRKAADVFFFNEQGLVERAVAHYCAD